MYDDGTFYKNQCDHQQTGRALVVYQPLTSRAPVSGRPMAAFVSHLLACTQQVPDFRQKRRASPEKAFSLYQETSAVRQKPHLAKICDRSF